MNYLLDTQSLIWALEENPRLSTKAKMLMEDGNNVLLVSIASLWEIAIKVNLGKIELTWPLEEIILKLPEADISILTIEPQHVLIVESLTLVHRDPFDRIIISQAIAEKIEIISSDDIFKLYPVIVHW
jgi:PIN domain nuclease of toxin-antitoxin system